MKLHIGGKVPHPEWKIFDAQPGPDVDFVGICTDLSQFADASIEAIYAAHVLEHLGYRDELPRTLAECCRVLKPGGEFMISVPNLDVLCSLFVADDTPEDKRLYLMHFMYGGQSDAYDFHKVGFTESFLRSFLDTAGFTGFRRVEDFYLFRDSSKLWLSGYRVSLNVIATK
jgi:predicted SAM-dependent methyltransferase